MPHLMRVLVVLSLVEAGDSHTPLSITQEYMTRRRNRQRCILFGSTADLQPAGSCVHQGVGALQALMIIPVGTSKRAN